MSGEKGFENYKFAQAPTNTPYVFPKTPSHNPDPSYRPMLFRILNETAEEAAKIHDCLAKPRLVQLQKLMELKKLNEEAKQLLIKDGYSEFLGGKRRKSKTQKKRKSKRAHSRRHKKN